MQRTIPIAALTAVICCGAWAQQPADAPAFEAASVKLVPPPDPSVPSRRTSSRGGPGSEDPTRVEFQNFPLACLVATAYNLAIWQVSGPDWLRLVRYDIAAKVPAGATREQCREMLRNLLVERFKLQAHHDKKDMLLYSLTVLKNGSKLKPHVEGGDQPQPEASGRPRTDSNGYPIMGRRDQGTWMIGGKARYQLDGADLERLVSMLSGQLKAQVNDDTGLKGKYDIALFWVAEVRNAGTDAEADGPDLFAAVQEQLGLKLEKKKGPVEVLVIDHAEKVPTAN